MTMPTDPTNGEIDEYSAGICGICGCGDGACDCEERGRTTNGNPSKRDEAGEQPITMAYVGIVDDYNKLRQSLAATKAELAAAREQLAKAEGEREEMRKALEERTPRTADGIGLWIGSSVWFKHYEDYPPMQMFVEGIARKSGVFMLYLTAEYRGRVHCAAVNTYSTKEAAQQNSAA